MRDIPKLLPASRLGRVLLLGVVAVTAVSLAVGLALPGNTSRAAGALAPTAAQGSASSGSVLNPNASTAPAISNGGRVIVVLRNQHSNLNLLKQGKLRRELAFHDQAPIVASIKAHGGGDLLQLVAVNAVAAKVSGSEVSRLLKLPSVARVEPDIAVNGDASAAVAPSASVPASQVQPPANPAPCPASSQTQPGVVQEPEADTVVHASDGNPGDPDMGNSIATGKGVVVANDDINNVQANPNFTRPDGTPVAVNVPPQDTTLLQGNDEFDEDMSSIAAQGTVVYQYDTGQTTGSNQGSLPFSGLPSTCKFYILGTAPGASLTDESDITVPHSTQQLESQIIAGIDHVTDAAQPPQQADEISESYGGGSFVPQSINTGNDAAVAAGVAVFVSSGDSGDSTQSGSSMNPLAADPAVMDLGATEGNRLIALNDGFQSYQSNQIGAISSGGVGSTFRVLDVVAPGWFGGESACVVSSGGCPSWYPTEAARGTSESAPLSAGGGADVIQAYRDTHGGASPTPVMIKDIIDGTATDLDDPSDAQGSGMLNVYRAVAAAQQMPGTTDVNGPPADARELIPSPSQLDVMGAAGTTTNTSLSLYNTNTSATTVTGTWRQMGPQFNLQPVLTENVSAPPFGTPVPPAGATAAAPITFNVPAGLDRLYLNAITPDPSNNTMLQIQLFDPNGTFVQESYDDGSTSQTSTTLGSATTVGATNISVPSVSGAVVGNKLSIDSGSNEEIATIAAIGRAQTNTTLTAAASANATNIEVAADSSVAVGDSLTIDSGTSQETATVSVVGSPTTNTTIRTATIAGATSVTVSSTTTAANFHAGDPVTIDTGTNLENDTVASVSGTTITLTTALAKPHGAAAALFDAGTGITLTSGLAKAHAAGATVFDAGTGITLTSGLANAHAAGVAVTYSGNGSEPNIQEIEVSAPIPGNWTAKIIWNGVDQDVAAPPPLPGLYTGPVSVNFQGSHWITSPATAPVTIPAHASATIPVSYTFPGTPGDYPQSIQFSADDGGTTSYPFVGRTLIPTGFNIPFSMLATSSVGRGGADSQVNQFAINVPAGSTQLSVNLTTPDASANNKMMYYLVSPGDTSSRCTAPACLSVAEPNTVNGVSVNNGTLTVANPAPGLWQVDAEVVEDLESGNEFTQVVSGTATVTPGVGVGGSVGSTLAVSLPAGSTAPSFGTFTPGVAQNYTQTVTANIISTAQSATLQAADACTPTATCFPGYLVNTSTGGPYALTQGLQVSGSDPGNAPGSGVFTDLSVTNPATLLSYPGPVSNDPVTITLKQPIAATDPLRTGTYSKTITFTLSTNSP